MPFSVSIAAAEASITGEDYDGGHPTTAFTDVDGGLSNTEFFEGIDDGGTV
jgi:hypothetical protein